MLVLIQDKMLLTGAARGPPSGARRRGKTNITTKMLEMRYMFFFFTREKSEQGSHEGQRGSSEGR